MMSKIVDLELLKQVMKDIVGIFDKYKLGQVEISLVVAELVRAEKVMSSNENKQNDR